MLVTNWLSVLFRPRRRLSRTLRVDAESPPRQARDPPTIYDLDVLDAERNTVTVRWGSFVTYEEKR